MKKIFSDLEYRMASTHLGEGAAEGIACTTEDLERKLRLMKIVENERKRYQPQGSLNRFDFCKRFKMTIYFIYIERMNMEHMFEKGYRIEAKDPLQGTKNEPVWALAQRDIALAMKLAEDPKSKTIAINFMGKSTP